MCSAFLVLGGLTSYKLLMCTNGSGKKELVCSLHRKPHVRVIESMWSLLLDVGEGRACWPSLEPTVLFLRVPCSPMPSRMNVARQWSQQPTCWQVRTYPPAPLAAAMSWSLLSRLSGATLARHCADGLAAAEHKARGWVGRVT